MLPRAQPRLSVHVRAVAAGGADDASRLSGTCEQVERSCSAAPERIVDPRLMLSIIFRDNGKVGVDVIFPACRQLGKRVCAQAFELSVDSEIKRGLVPEADSESGSRLEFPGIPRLAIVIPDPLRQFDQARQKMSLLSKSV
jgi:hypothetical protein